MTHLKDITDHFNYHVNLYNPVVTGLLRFQFLLLILASFQLTLPFPPPPSRPLILNQFLQLSISLNSNLFSKSLHSLSILTENHLTLSIFSTIHQFTNHAPSRITLTLLSNYTVSILTVLFIHTFLYIQLLAYTFS